MSTLNELFLRKHQRAIVMHPSPYKLSGLKQAQFMTSHNSLGLPIWRFLYLVLFRIPHRAVIIWWLDCDQKPHLHVEKLVLAINLGIFIFLPRPSYLAIDETSTLNDDFEFQESEISSLGRNTLSFLPLSIGQNKATHVPEEREKEPSHEVIKQQNHIETGMLGKEDFFIFANNLPQRPYWSLSCIIQIDKF